jgi:hypothetical protein
MRRSHRLPVGLTDKRVDRERQARHHRHRDGIGELVVGESQQLAGARNRSQGDDEGPQTLVVELSIFPEGAHHFVRDVEGADEVVDAGVRRFRDCDHRRRRVTRMTGVDPAVVPVTVADGGCVGEDRELGLRQVREAEGRSGEVSAGRRGEAARDDGSFTVETGCGAPDRIEQIADDSVYTPWRERRVVRGPYEVDDRFRRGIHIHCVTSPARD